MASLWSLPGFVLMLSVLSVLSTSSLGAGSPKTSCPESERAALLDLKAAVGDFQNFLSSWKGKDCCHWTGVSCDKDTGHVTALDLGSYQLANRTGALDGSISPSLLNLTHLNHLDLSSNFINGMHIPAFIGSLKNLRYLNLGDCNLDGPIPPELGNLSSLVYLDLRLGRWLDPGNLQWLSRLSSLQYLDLSYANFTLSSNWLQVVSALPSLKTFNCEYCRLSGIQGSLPHVNFTSLNTLDLEGNSFNSSFPSWLWNLSSLSHLNLKDCGFHGPIPDALGNLTSLEFLNLGSNGLSGTLPRTIGNLCHLSTLDLSYNQIGGEITVLAEGPRRCTWNKLQTLRLISNELRGNLTGWLENMTSLEVLDLGSNMLEGPVPAAIGKFSQLAYLDLSLNSLEGILTEDHFANLTKLTTLSLSLNSLTLDLDANWVPPFQLEDIGLRSCKLGPRFPAWLQWQKNINELDLSNTGIADTVPHWLWNTSSKMITLILSNNQIYGKLPASLEFMGVYLLDLSSNRLEGSMPRIPYSILTLVLSNNSFSGPLPQSFDAEDLGYLGLSNNLFTGSIPSSICSLASLNFLDLSNNRLSGELPQCLGQSLTSISSLNLGNNNFSGRIPTSLGSLNQLMILQLSNNSLSQEFPSVLRHCKSLTFLDLGSNKFTGSIPAWIGDSLPNLVILRLQSNMFSGNIPPHLAQLVHLQVLDLSNNRLSGSIPSSFRNFSAMASKTKESVNGFSNFTYGASFGNYIMVSFQSKIMLVMKGEEREYAKILYLVKSMDISSNNLSGEIPKEISTLSGLNNLNLSGNHLTGKIPDNIGGLQSVESLDLSLNKLSGSIPPSLTSLNSLSHLNLSYNNLSGSIPTGNQLQTLNDPSIYIGNINLCGSPLNKSCTTDKTSQVQNEEHGDEDEMQWFYLSMGIGFVVGFWVIFASLLFKATWRKAYFQFIDKTYDKLYVAVALFVARRRRIE